MTAPIVTRSGHVIDQPGGLAILLDHAIFTLNRPIRHENLGTLWARIADSAAESSKDKVNG